MSYSAKKCTSKIYICLRIFATDVAEQKTLLEILAFCFKLKRPYFFTCRKVACVEQFVRKCDNKPLGKIEEWRKECKDIE